MASKLAHYLGRAAAADTRVHRLVLGGDGWDTVRRRLSRCGADYVRVPLAGGRIAVYTDAPFGEVVGQLEPALTRDFEAARSERRNVSSSAAWKERTAAARDSEWELLGLSPRPLEEVVQIAHDCGVVRGQVDPAHLPHTSESWVLDPAAPAWAWFERRIGLCQPQPRRRRPTIAAEGGRSMSA